MRQLEASYTVELALILPVIIFVLLTPVYMAYELYQQTKNASVLGWEATFDAEENVRKIKFLEDIWEE